MKLKDWMKKERWTATAIADALGVSAATINRVKKGASPRLELANAIERFTGGEVSTLELEGEDVQCTDECPSRS